LKTNRFPRASSTVKPGVTPADFPATTRSVREVSGPVVVAPLPTSSGVRGRYPILRSHHDELTASSKRVMFSASCCSFTRSRTLKGSEASSHTASSRSSATSPGLRSRGSGMGRVSA
jgi:hypothetical protein